MIAVPLSQPAHNALVLLAEDVKVGQALILERLLAAALITMYFGPPYVTAKSRAARFDCLYPDGFRHLMEGHIKRILTNENENEEPIHDAP